VALVQVTAEGLVLVRAMDWGLGRAEVLAAASTDRVTGLRLRVYFEK
jgi:hypothetical protein